jgi:hypothetical protein
LRRDTSTLRTLMPIPPTVPESDTNRLARLRGAVTEKLARGRRGEETPAFIELLALHKICTELGAHDLSADIRRYITEATHLRHMKPLVVSR